MMPEADVGMRCIKYMLFTTNFMFALIGFLLISVGSTITSIYSDFQLFMEEHYFSPAALLIAIGVIIFCVSLFGCFGAIKKSTCLTNTYGILLAIILVMEISAAIAGYSMRLTIRDYVEDRMKNSLTDYDKEPYTKQSWDTLQESLECCGIHNASDWKPLEIPRSCLSMDGPMHFYNSGCLNKLSYIVSECAGLIGTGGLCVAIVQLLGVIFAFMLAKSIRRLKTANEMQRQADLSFYAQFARSNSEKPTPVLYTPTNSEA